MQRRDFEPHECHTRVCVGKGPAVTKTRSLTLMREALVLLDRGGNGATIVACHLQAAIDAAEGAKPLRRSEEIDDDLTCEFGDAGHVARDKQGEEG